jgi:hypothetical protein
MSVTTTGCIRKVLIDGNVSATRRGADAVNTLHDFEVARAVARAGIGQLEGMYKLAPYNEDALFMLTRTWAGVSYAFTEDDYEQAEEGKDDALTAYHLNRTVAGFLRAKFFATQLLNKKAAGFEAATRNADTIREWMTRNFTNKEEAEDLTWIGYAFVGLVGVSKGDIPAISGELYVGVAITERALQLDEKFEHGLNHIILGAYHARSAMAELEEGKKHFDAAMAISEGKFLSVQLNYAKAYYCNKSDHPNYTKMLNAVLAGGDPIPEARLQNLIAKRRARRYLDNKIFQEDCGFVD